jgi:hypothetical protein
MRPASCCTAVLARCHAVCSCRVVRSNYPEIDVMLAGLYAADGLALACATSSWYAGFLKHSWALIRFMKSTVDALDADKRARRPR